MFFDILFLILGFVFLVLGGEWLLKSSVTFSLEMGVPKMVVGLTIVSFATSAPELIVSLNAAMSGSPGIALGNVIGSNIANLGLVLGVTCIIMTISVSKHFFKTDWAVMIGVTLLLIGFIYFDHQLQRYEGLILVLILVAYIVYLLKVKKSVTVEELEETDDEVQWIFVALFMILGGVALWGGSELLVNSAQNIATEFGVSESVIGLTIVAFGTSVPELAASVMAAIKKEEAISLGNLIGSNIFNILSVLGITAIIHPINVSDIRFINNDIWWMLGTALILLPLSFVFKKYRLGTWSGVVLLVSYIIYVALAF